jgi:hypothetical protein
MWEGQEGAVGSRREEVGGMRREVGGCGRDRRGRRGRRWEQGKAVGSKGSSREQEAG